MGAHFAQKIVELEKDNVVRDSLKSSTAGLDFSHLNDSHASGMAASGVDPNK